MILDIVTHDYFIDKYQFHWQSQNNTQNIRGGKDSDESFFSQNLNQQAFFSYFLVTDKFIAARGRGGGLALWQKIN